MANLVSINFKLTIITINTNCCITIQVATPLLIG